MTLWSYCFTDPVLLLSNNPCFVTEYEQYRHNLYFILNCILLLCGITFSQYDFSFWVYFYLLMQQKFRAWEFSHYWHLKHCWINYAGDAHHCHYRLPRLTPYSFLCSRRNLVSETLGCMSAQACKERHGYCCQEKRPILCREWGWLLVAQWAEDLDSSKEGEKG